MPGKNLVFRKIIRELELTSDQKAHLKDKKKEIRNKSIDIRAEIEKKQNDKADAFKELDFKKVKLLNKDISNLRLQISNNFVYVLEEFVKALTDEQKDKLKSLIPEDGWERKRHKGKTRHRRKRKFHNEE